MLIWKSAHPIGSLETINYAKGRISAAKGESYLTLKEKYLFLTWVYQKRATDFRGMGSSSMESTPNCTRRVQGSMTDILLHRKIQQNLKRGSYRGESVGFINNIKHQLMSEMTYLWDCSWKICNSWFWNCANQLHWYSYRDFQVWGEKEKTDQEKKRDRKKNEKEIERNSTKTCGAI